MASITPILGTDSLSSSRVVINFNFESIRTDLADIAALLNTSNQTLSLTGEITSSGLNIVNGATNLFDVNSTDIVSSVDHTFESAVTFQGAVISSVYGDDANPATVLPTAGNWEHETYFVNNGTYTMTNGLQGQNVTIVAATGGDVTLNAAEVSGAAVDVVIPVGTALTLRFLGTQWYIV